MKAGKPQPGLIDPRFWHALDRRVKGLTRGGLTKFQAKVLEVGSPGGANAGKVRVQRYGEGAQSGRGFSPVIGAVPAVGDTVWCFGDFAGPVVMTGGGGAPGGGVQLLGAKNAADALSTYPEGSSLAYADATTTGWPTTHALVITHRHTDYRNRQIVYRSNTNERWERFWDPDKAGGAGWTPFARKGRRLVYDYVSTTDIANGAALTQNAWTNVGPQHSFSVVGPESLIEIVCGGIVLVGSASAVTSTNLSRLLLDGAIALPLGGTNSNGAADYVNSLAGAVNNYRSGLTAGNHTLQLQVKPNGVSQVMYCRSASQPGEAMKVQVLEEA